MEPSGTQHRARRKEAQMYWYFRTAYLSMVVLYVCLTMTKKSYYDQKQRYLLFPWVFKSNAILKSLLKYPELSESSLDVLIPSYPGSPRSLNAGSEGSLAVEREKRLREAVDYLHRDNEFLVAAEIGNDKMLEKLMRTAGTDIQQVDHLGRNALHLAVCADSYRNIVMLLKAGVNPTVKDNVGMTPLSLCLMRRPSIRVANLLFEYGAVILPRTACMDTGLFIQFVMMCVPTSEEAKILRLLVEKGALVNDSNAPGGRQPLHFAAMSNNCDLIEILIELGADLYMTNHRGETPREVAQTFKCRDAQALLEALEDLDSDSTTSFTTVATDTRID